MCTQWGLHSSVIVTLPGIVRAIYCELFCTVGKLMTIYQEVKVFLLCTDSDYCGSPVNSETFSWGQDWISLLCSLRNCYESTKRISYRHVCTWSDDLTATIGHCLKVTRASSFFSLAWSGVCSTLAPYILKFFERLTLQEWVVEKFFFSPNCDPYPDANGSNPNFSANYI